MAGNDFILIPSPSSHVSKLISPPVPSKHLPSHFKIRHSQHLPPPFRFFLSSFHSPMHHFETLLYTHTHDKKTPMKLALSSLSLSLLNWIQISCPSPFKKINRSFQLMRQPYVCMCVCMCEKEIDRLCVCVRAREREFILHENLIKFKD